MTEADWLGCTRPGPLLDFLLPQAGQRKLRLFVAACCRGIWTTLSDERSRKGLEMVEKLADGLEGEEKLRRARDEAAADEVLTAADSTARQGPQAIWYALLDQDFVVAAEVVRFAVKSFFSHQSTSQEARTAFAQEARRQVALLHDIFGNPFRPLQPLSPALLQWNGGLVTRLAEETYEHRLLPSGHLDPKRLAVLADALEEAGCDDAAILGHLRALGPHVRGCHVLDALTGKEVPA